MREAKQVIVIRRDLKMRRGKEIAQGAHAAMAWLIDRLIESRGFGSFFTMSGILTEAERAWIEGPFTKVCCQVNSEEELTELHKRACAAGLTSKTIVDSGRTEFGGKETLTALAIGPGWAEEIDPITGHLSLY